MSASALDELVRVTVRTTHRGAVHGVMSLRQRGELKSLQSKRSLNSLTVPVTVRVGSHEVTFPPGTVRGVE